ncbi:DNA alkylation repair protein [Polymorphobacter glacialis]|uniref:DNA alkylation repair protein n=1 Tax=Sandarakinorhabdus glacialis TaxID=1614636 RepID=A0A917E9W2_9SPHN|nr:hypothetical protein [Polymorphobacter glacialis]GGE17171.1 DNA alkylation repair protein [Polymorphobacter glacialis]
MPWAARISALKADPTLAAPILGTLKSDDSLYVRKSVANHLNDIAKDRPDWLLDHLAGWTGDDPRTVWIIRHALRTLIKKGGPRALALIGVGHGAQVEASFAIAPTIVRLGDSIALTAGLFSTVPEPQRLVVDYRITYARAAGRTSAKVFKWKSFDLAAGDTANLALRQSIRDFSTRRHHPGRHDVELIVNGKTMASAAFEIVAG